MKNNPFTDKVVIITGASAGIGKALALQLAKRGAKLSLAARDEKKLEEVALQCKEHGGEAIVVRTDITSEDECKKLIEETIKTYDKLDILINNAGVSMWARFDEISDPSLFEKIMKVNYLGSVYCTYYALPHLKKSRGQIVAVSSLTGKTGVPTRSGYAASKHAMAGFFDSLRIELNGTGVSVTTIYPGFVATEVRERAFNKHGEKFAKSPMKESGLMSAEKCAALIIKATEKRKRELVMTAKGKIGVWMKLISPTLVDTIARKSIKEK